MYLVNLVLGNHVLDASDGKGYTCQLGEYEESMSYPSTWEARQIDYHEIKAGLGYISRLFQTIKTKRKGCMQLVKYEVGCGLCRAEAWGSLQDVEESAVSLHMHKPHTPGMGEAVWEGAAVLGS